MKPIMLLCLAFYLSHSSFAQNNLPPQIELKAYAEKVVMHDLLKIQMTLKATHLEAKVAMEEIVAMKKRLSRELPQLKIDEDSIKTINLNTYQRYHNPQKNEKVYYEAKEELELIIAADTKITANILGIISNAVPEIGIHLIPQISKALKEQYNRELIEKTIQKAVKDAQIIAVTSGYAKAQVHRVNYQPSGSDPIFRSVQYEMSEASQKELPDYQFKQQTLRKEMTFTFNMYH